MSFKTAQTKMIEYLASDEFHEREDAQTTIKSIPILQKIIKRGLITNDSQEGNIYNGFNDNTKKYYQIKERAYITGFMKSAHAELFVDKINSGTDKIAFIIKMNDTKEFYDDFVGDGYIPKIVVTTQGASSDKKKIKLKGVTNMLTILPKKVIEVEIKRANLKKSDSVEYVVCIDPTYGRNARSTSGLYKDVLNYL